MTDTDIVITFKMDFSGAIKGLQDMAKAARFAANSLEQMDCMFPGAWPDQFVLLSRRMRYGFREKAFGGEIVASM